jgi:hypothetical protein
MTQNDYPAGALHILPDLNLAHISIATDKHGSKLNPYTGSLHILLQINLARISNIWSDFKICAQPGQHFVGEFLHKKIENFLKLLQTTTISRTIVCLCVFKTGKLFLSSYLYKYLNIDLSCDMGHL